MHHNGYVYGKTKLELQTLKYSKMENTNNEKQCAIHDVMQCLLQEIEKLDVNDDHKDWYTATLQHRLTEVKKQDGNLAVGILNALEDYLK